MDFKGTRRFQVLSQLGMGGMGVVYEVFDRERQVRLAVKALRRPGGEALLRFKNEFRARQDLEHPNLVSLGELFEEEGLWFFTMELVEGVDLLAYVTGAERAAGRVRAALQVDTLSDLDEPRPEGEPARAEVAALPAGGGAHAYDGPRLRAAFGQLARGVMALHGAGKVHRDLKPSNVRVTPEGRVVLLDFGLMVDASAKGGPAAKVAGTPLYMAPEQAASSAVGPAADWYAFGVLLFEALTGRLPFVGSNAEVLLDKQRLDAPPPSFVAPGVPEDLDRLCGRLLQRNSTDRPSGPEVLRVLQPELAPDAPVGDVGRQPLFVGRARELEELQIAFRAAEAGRPVTVVLEGESGIGKSTLLRRFLAGLERGPRRVVLLAGRCYERESVPYRALDGVVDVLGRWLEGLPDHELRELLSPFEAGLLAKAFPVLRRLPYVERAPLPREHLAEPQRLRSQVFDCVRELFLRLARHTPVVVAIDDIQWADSDSLALLRAITNPPSEAPLMLIATLRRSGAGLFDGAGAAGPLAGFKGERRLLRLEPLGEEEARALAGAYLRGAAFGATSAELVATEAAGHPLFIEELTHELGARARGGERPPRLDDALWERIQALEPTLRRVLELVVISGMPVRRDVLARAVGVADLGRELAALVAQRLVKTTGAAAHDGVEPYHDRTQQALSLRLSPEDCRAGHARLAEALEALIERLPRPDVAFALAHHHDAADNPHRAFSHALVAAEVAQRRFALRAAEKYLRIAERAVGSASRLDRRRVLEGLGKVLLFLGRYAEAERSLRQASALAESRLDRAQIEIWLGELAFQQQAWAAAAAALQRALVHLERRVPRRPGPWRVLGQGIPRTLRRWLPWLPRLPRAPGSAEDSLAAQIFGRISALCFLSGQWWPSAWTHLRRVQLAERSTSPDERALAFAHHSFFLASFGWYSWADDYARAALEMHQTLGDEGEYAQSLCIVGIARYFASRTQESLTLLGQAASRLERLGSRWEAALARMVCVLAGYRRGDLAKVRESCEQLYRQAELAEYSFIADIVLLAWIKVMGAAIPFEPVGVATVRAQGKYHQLIAQHTLAVWRLLAADDVDGCLEVSRRALALIEIPSELSAEVLCWHATALRVKAAHAEGEASRAATLREGERTARRAEAMARRFQNCLPHALRERALLAALRGRTASAMEWLDRSVEVATRQQAQLERGRSLLARGRLKRGLALLEGDAEIATACELLRSLGSEPAGRDDAGELRQLLGRVTV